MGLGTSMPLQLCLKLNCFQNTNSEKNTSGRYTLCSQNEKENMADLRGKQSGKGYQGQSGGRGSATRP